MQIYFDTRISACYLNPKNMHDLHKCFQTLLWPIVFQSHVFFFLSCLFFFFPSFLARVLLTPSRAAFLLSQSMRFDTENIPIRFV